MKALAASYQIEDGPNERVRCSSGRAGLPTISRRRSRTPKPRRRRSAPRRPICRTSPRRAALPRPFPLFVFDAFTEYQEQGPDYIVAILNGFTHPNDPNWNLYFPGHKIAMPKPLADGAVQYTDGTPPTLANYYARCCGFPLLGSRTQARRAQGDGLSCPHLPDRLRDVALFHQEAHLGECRPLIALLDRCKSPASCRAFSFRQGLEDRRLGAAHVALCPCRIRDDAHVASWQIRGETAVAMEIPTGSLRSPPSPKRLSRSHISV